MAQSFIDNFGKRITVISYGFELYIELYINFMESNLVFLQTLACHKVCDWYYNTMFDIFYSQKWD